MFALGNHPHYSAATYIVVGIVAILAVIAGVVHSFTRVPRQKRAEARQTAQKLHRQAGQLLEALQDGQGKPLTKAVNDLLAAHDVQDDTGLRNYALLLELRYLSLSRYHNQVGPPAAKGWTLEQYVQYQNLITELLERLKVAHKELMRELQIYKRIGEQYGQLAEAIDTAHLEIMAAGAALDTLTASSHLRTHELGAMLDIARTGTQKSGRLSDLLQVQLALLLAQAVMREANDLPRRAQACLNMRGPYSRHLTAGRKRIEKASGAFCQAMPLKYTLAVYVPVAKLLVHAGALLEKAKQLHRDLTNYTKSDVQDWTAAECAGAAITRLLNRINELCEEAEFAMQTLASQAEDARQLAELLTTKVAALPARLAERAGNQQVFTGQVQALSKRIERFYGELHQKGRLFSPQRDLRTAQMLHADLNGIDIASALYGQQITTSLAASTAANNQPPTGV